MSGQARMLDCTGLEKSWGGVRALDGVDFAVLPGEILGLAGANGAGKTTLLNAIGGQVTPDAGRIEFEGRRLEHMSPHVPATARHRPHLPDDQDLRGQERAP